MGFDLGAIHAADGAADAIGADLASRPADWLHASAKTAASAVEKAFEEPRSASTRQGKLALYPYKLYSRNPPNVERRMIRLRPRRWREILSAGRGVRRPSPA